MNNTAPTVTFLENLRSATAQSHTSLEKLPVSESIINPEVTKEQYTLYLSLMQDVVKDAEENIFPLLKNVVTDLKERNKNHLLSNDLTVLGYHKKEEIKPLSAALNNHSVAFALGIMYVIEGSSLGGRVILKNITDALGYTPENGASYFGGYGNKTGSHWKNFLAALTLFEAENNCAEDIIAGADFAFNAINLHFTKNTSK